MSSSNTTRVSNTGQHTLCIEGLPSHYTWQDIKDLARNKAEHGIRANIVEKPGLRGEKIIICFVSVSRRNEAISLYDWLTTGRIEGRYLTVHLFDDDGCFQSNCKPSDRACSVCKRPQAQHPRNTADIPPDRQPASLLYTTSPSPNSYHEATTLPSALASRPDAAQLQAAATVLRSRIAAGLELDANQEEFLRRMTQLTVQDAPAYAAASGAMINTSKGYARTEVRGVFVQGLDYKTGTKDVEGLFAKAGQVTKCEVHTNSQGKSKGTAAIQFATAAEARHAIRSLDQFKWKGRMLRVRSDRETVVTESPTIASSSSRTNDTHKSSGLADQEPLIVDGSNRRQARRDSKVTPTK